MKNQDPRRPGNRDQKLGREKREDPYMMKWLQYALLFLTIFVLGIPEGSAATCVARDGSFCQLENGMVLDKNTGLMWAPEDNGRDISWADARAFCESYRGGGYTDWRMPLQEDLAGLYDRQKRYRTSQTGQQVYLTDLVRVSTGWVWASETRGPQAAYFDFPSGERLWVIPSAVGYFRALPVRSHH